MSWVDSGVGGCVRVFVSRVSIFFWGGIELVLWFGSVAGWRGEPSLRFVVGGAWIGLHVYINYILCVYGGTDLTEPEVGLAIVVVHDAAAAGHAAGVDDDGGGGVCDAVVWGVGFFCIICVGVVVLLYNIIILFVLVLCFLFKMCFIIIVFCGG